MSKSRLPLPKSWYAWQKHCDGGRGEGEVLCNRKCMGRKVCGLVVRQREERWGRVGEGEGRYSSGRRTVKADGEGVGLRGAGDDALTGEGGRGGSEAEHNSRT
jgi:hypothetical protein